jgi:hypothetical protein
MHDAQLFYSGSKRPKSRQCARSAITLEYIVYSSKPRQLHEAALCHARTRASVGRRACNICLWERHARTRTAIHEGSVQPCVHPGVIVGTTWTASTRF